MVRCRVVSLAIGARHAGQLLGEDLVDRGGGRAGGSSGSMASSARVSVARSAMYSRTRMAELSSGMGDPPVARQLLGGRLIAGQHQCEAAVVIQRQVAVGDVSGHPPGGEADAGQHLEPEVGTGSPTPVEAVAVVAVEFMAKKYSPSGAGPPMRRVGVFMEKNRGDAWSMSRESWEHNAVARARTRRPSSNSRLVLGVRFDRLGQVVEHLTHELPSFQG